jgi:transcriptional regulator with XRE-family HTH domain
MLEAAIARVLKAHRLKRKITQAELGYLTGLDTQTISRIERSERLPSLETILLISKALETTASHVLKQVEDAEPNIILQEQPQQVLRLNKRKSAKKRKKE